MANINPRMQCMTIGRIAGEIKVREVNGGTSYSIPVITDRGYIARNGQRPSDYLFYEYYVGEGKNPGVLAQNQDGSFKWLIKGNLVQLNFEVHSYQKFDNQGNKAGTGMQLSIVPGGITLLASSQKNMQSGQTAQLKATPQNTNVQPSASQPTVAAQPETQPTAPKAPTIDVKVPSQTNQGLQSSTPSDIDPNSISDEDLPF